MSTPPRKDLPISTITHTATVTRRGGWWVVSIPALDVVTLTARAADIEGAAREAVAAHLEVPLATVRVQVIGGVDPGNEPAD
ncbi:hypothetical protein [Nakamurella leprariae]|uniref:Uncharacterized protein n=1 Tax=Nakamurella leprariae TaxID=2803911 RepID=A0A938YAL9_9ACTN|nr:hypothetical protein [Nakamurella leprariae]MBM9466101.1 hypothetical protein [Nakamurella leprariae]